MIGGVPARGRAALFVAALTGFLIACESLTDPGAGPDIVLSFDSDTTVVVGDVITPDITVSVDGVAVDRSRVQLFSSNIEVLQVAPTNDTLFVVGRGLVTLTMRLVGSTLGDTPPEVDQVLRAVAQSVRIVEPAQTLRSLNDTVRLTPEALDIDGMVIPNSPAAWTSSDATVATVAASTGLVTAKKNGTATITTVIDDDTATVNVTVTQLLRSFTATPDEVMLPSLGDTVRIVATPLDSGGSPIPLAEAPTPSWLSQDISTASVSADGLVTGLKNGLTSIRIRADNGVDTVDVIRNVAIIVQQISARLQIFGPDSVGLTAIGDEIQLASIAFDTLDVDIQTRTPIWRSSNVSAIQVTQDGLVRALAEGDAFVSAQLDNTFDTVRVTSVIVPTALEITPATLNISSVGDIVTAIATPRDKFGAALTGFPITWSSLDGAIATVQSDGSVAGIAVGITRVVAELTNGVADTMVVDVKNIPETVQITPTDTTLASIDDQWSPTVDFRNARGDALGRSSVTWSSDDPGVAAPNPSGVITAISRGTTVIRATSAFNPARTDSVTVVVTNAPELVELNRTSDVLAAPTLTLPYQATITNARGSAIVGETITWNTTDPAVATVNSAGLVTAVDVGTTDVIALVTGAAGDRADTALLEIRNDAVSVNVSPTATVVPSVGAQVQLSGSARNAADNDIPGVSLNWSSSDNVVATVDGTGLVTGQSVGPVTITASLNTLSATASIDVINGPETVTFLSAGATLASVADAYFPGIELLNGAGTPLLRTSAAWSSNNVLIVTVDPNGLVTATGRGAAVVRAENPDNVSQFDEITVTVTNAPDSIIVNRAQPADTLSSLLRTLQYDATVFNARGDVIFNEPVTWLSSVTGVATITTSGLATAVGVGTTTISAEAGSVSDDNVLVVLNTPANVEVSPSPINLSSTGQTVLLSVTVRNEQGNVISSPVITFTPVNALVADVDITGLVTATGAGSSAIDVTSGPITNSVTVNVSNDPVSIDITADTLTLASLGDNVTATATILNGLGTPLSQNAATWTSDNPAIANVTSLGLVTAVSQGFTKIRATSPSAAAITDSVVIEVTNAPASVTLNAASHSFTALGETFQFTATIRNAANDIIAGAPITWTTTDVDSVSVSPTGLTTAVGVTASETITAEAAAGITAAATVDVSNDAVSISVNPARDTIPDLGATTQLNAAALNDRGNPIPASEITWIALDPAIATVSTTGLVTADIAVTGVARIEAAQGGVADTAQIEVLDVVRTLDIIPTLDTLASVGEQVTPTATIENNANVALARTSVNWSTSASQVATVSADGIVTAQGNGSAIIRAQSPFDILLRDSMTIVVANAASRVVLSDSLDTFIDNGQDILYSAEVQNASGDPIPGELISWSSDDPGIASVNSSGPNTALITAGSSFGVTNVIATADGGAIADTTVITRANPTVIWVSADSIKGRTHGTPNYPFRIIPNALILMTSLGGSDTVRVQAAPGPYNATISDFTVTTILEGDTVGTGCTIASCPTPANLPVIQRNNNNQPVLSSTNADVSLRFFRIEHSVSNAQAAVDFNGGSVTLDRVYISEAVGNGSGILLRNGTGVSRIANSDVFGVRGYGIRIENPIGDSVIVENVTIESIRVDGGDPGAGIDILGASDVTVRTSMVTRTEGPRIFVRGGSSDVTIRGNAFTGTATQIRMDTVTGTSRVDTNTIDMTAVTGELGSGTQGIDIQNSTGVTFEGNLHSGSGGTTDAIHASFATFTITNDSVGGGRYAVIADSSTITSSGLRIGSVVTGFQLGEENTVTSTTDRITASGRCIVIDDVATSATFDDLTLQSCGSLTEAVFVDGTGSRLEIMNSVLTGFDRRWINFMSGQAMILTNVTMIGTASGGVVADELAVVNVEAADTAIVANSFIEDFPGRIGIRMSASAWARIETNRLVRNRIGFQTVSVPGATPGTDYDFLSNEVYDNTELGADNLPSNTAVLAGFWGDALGPRNHTAGTSDSIVGDSITFVAAAPAFTGFTAAATTVSSFVPAAAEAPVGGRFIVVRGAGQTIAINTEITVVLAVRVVDAAGLPVVGVDVTFESSQASDDFVPGSAVNPVTRTTDANGIVKVPMLVDGNPGIRTVTITATNLTAATIDVDVP